MNSGSGCRGSMSCSNLGRLGFRTGCGPGPFAPHGGAAGFHGGPDGFGLVDVNAGAVDPDSADDVAAVSGPAAFVGRPAPVSVGHDVRELCHVPVAWIGFQSYPPFDDLDIVVVFFELPFLDGMLVHESLRLFEGDALLVVGGGRIVGYRQQPADAFHDTFRVHMIPFGFGLGRRMDGHPPAGQVSSGGERGQSSQ